MSLAVQNATGLPVRCESCGVEYSPAFRPTHGPIMCALCGIKCDLAIAAAIERLTHENEGVTTCPPK